jgi:hypothetical protein
VSSVVIQFDRPIVTPRSIKHPGSCSSRTDGPWPGKGSSAGVGQVRAGPVDQTWFECVIACVRSRYGQIVWPDAFLLVFGLRHSTVMPMRRIGVAKCLRLAMNPSARRRSPGA